ncbi:hypothetical protein ACFXDH_02610 [Streptomyces sp. NPDC059467]|uniref:hypothetical protein n=1 Tax=Streptomyces sp. NPDC059467 TaxID=3346844 RepID=UPI003680E86E
MRRNSRDVSRKRAQRGLTRNKWSHISMMSIPPVLLLTTVTLGFFGIENLNSALTFPGRITGAALVGVSLISLLGAAALVDHSLWHCFPHSRLVVLFSAFISFLTNFLLLVHIATSDSIKYRVLFSVLTLGSAWAVLVVWRTSVVIPAPKRVATAVIATLVVGLGNFTYQNLYLPSKVEVRPIIKISTEKPVTSRDRKKFAVPVTITLENHSDVSFDVLGTEFHAMAQRVRLSPQDQRRQDWRTEAREWSTFERTNPLSRREVHQPGDLMEAQPWIRYGDPIGAHDTVAARIVVQLPMDTPYDQLAFYASAHITRKDRASLDKFHPATKEFSWLGGKLPDWMKTQKDYKNYDSIIYEADLKESNAIDAHTRDLRHLTVYWRFSLHGADIREAITAHGKDESAKSTEDRYGIRVVEAGPVELTLWDIKSQK